MHLPAFVFCLSVCEQDYSKTRAWIWMKCCVSTDVATWTNEHGDRSFSAAGPPVWNDLPPGLRQPELSFVTFRRQLKTCLFSDRSA